MKNTLILISSLLLLAASAVAQTTKQAIIFVDPEVLQYADESFFTSMNEGYEWAYYQAHGYSVSFQPATEDNIVAAALDGNTRAMSFFGHGFTSSGATSTILYIDDEAWMSNVFTALRTRYIAAGLSKTEATRRADEESQNFGFDVVRNHSCGSLIDTRLAHQFVRPGGSYFGVPALYYPCPTPYALGEGADWTLEEYIVPGVTPPTVISPSVILSPSVTGPDGPCAVDRGPAGGCIPGMDGEAGCIPCPGDEIRQYYIPSSE